MLRIRLQRVGRKHEPSFRAVLTESQNSTKTGRIKEVLGNYDPRFHNPTIKADRVKYWISVGAKPTDTMHNLLISQKIIEGKKKNVLSKKSLVVKKPVASEEKPTTEAKVEETTEEATAPAEDISKNETKEDKEESIKTQVA